MNNKKSKDKTKTMDLLALEKSKLEKLKKGEQRYITGGCGGCWEVPSSIGLIYEKPPIVDQPFNDGDKTSQ